MRACVHARMGVGVGGCRAVAGEPLVWVSVGPNGAAGGSRGWGRGVAVAADSARQLHAAEVPCRPDRPCRAKSCPPTPAAPPRPPPGAGLAPCVQVRLAPHLQVQAGVRGPRVVRWAPGQQPVPGLPDDPQGQRRSGARARRFWGRHHHHGGGVMCGAAAALGRCRAAEAATGEGQGRNQQPAAASLPTHAPRMFASWEYTGWGRGAACQARDAHCPAPKQVCIPVPCCFLGGTCRSTGACPRRVAAPIRASAMRQMVL